MPGPSCTANRSMWKIVPVVGMVTSAFYLGESLPGWKLQAAALVIAGLVLCVFGPRLQARLRPAVAGNA